MQSALARLKMPVMTKTPMYSLPKASFMPCADSGPAKAAITPPDTTSVTARACQWGGTTSTAAKRKKNPTPMAMPKKIMATTSHAGDCTAMHTMPNTVPTIPKAMPRKNPYCRPHCTNNQGVTHQLTKEAPKKKVPKGKLVKLVAPPMSIKITPLVPTTNVTLETVQAQANKAKVKLPISDRVKLRGVVMDGACTVSGDDSSSTLVMVNLLQSNI
mmetsp:Transcript_36360/g.75673  ORF Transcript_36360/g.75673 Transcript_36360/m.75673 type:complete len:215 (-) Transcript_36360:165-809(-)